VANDFFTGSERAREVFAALIEADRAEILAAYASRLEETGNPIVKEAASRQQAIANGGQILTDVIRSIRAGKVRIDESHKTIAWDIGETRAARGLHTREVVQAAMLFFQVAVTFMARHVVTETISIQLFVIVLLTMNQSISMRIREATNAYGGYLLSKIHEAHIGERHRIARELHDRVGNVLSTAHRQLELCQLHQERNPGFSAGRLKKAQQSVTASMESLRAVTSELALQEPVQSLERALTACVDSAQTHGVKLLLRINGDETWAPPAVRDESFLVIREAIRNAVDHGAPRVVFVGMDIAPHEFRAWVEDDGRGFDPSHNAQSGLGLLSMRERAALMGGTLTVSTRQDQGTLIELLVPLPGNRDDAAK
jgi:signal transduction histidine kinase